MLAGSELGAPIGSPIAESKRREEFKVITRFAQEGASFSNWNVASVCSPLLFNMINDIFSKLECGWENARCNILGEGVGK